MQSEDYILTHLTATTLREQKTFSWLFAKAARLYYTETQTVWF